MNTTRLIRRAIAGITVPVTMSALAVAGLSTQAETASAAPAPTCARMAPVTGLAAVTYADRLVRAWGRGDTRATACYAAPAVLNALWSISDVGGGHWKRTASEGAAGTIYVTYTNQAGPGRIVLGVTNVGLRGNGGWHAARVATVSGNPVHGSRSDALVRAWGIGDRTAAAWFARPAVTTRLFAYRHVGGSHWYLVSTEGTAGSIYTVYRDRASGASITLRTLDPYVTGTWAHDVVSVTIHR